ncbi:hypothetical protein AGMMS49983_06820 [Clostridia bacterium]|nr:hypothetical protein AGMMS49983_06820 [Clostridia bacterium]
MVDFSKGSNLLSIDPNSDDVSGFASYVKRYKAGLAVETAAVSVRHFSGLPAFGSVDG